MHARGWLLLAMGEGRTEEMRRSSMPEKSECFIAASLMAAAERSIQDERIGRISLRLSRASRCLDGIFLSIRD